MMRLSAMWAVSRTIDDDGHTPVADALLRHWEHDDVRPRFWRSSANVLFTVTVGGQRCFLRFVGTDERERAAIEQECAFVRWLDAQGIAVALPVAARDGDDVVTEDTAVGPVHAVLWQGVPGEHPDIDALDARRFARWGAALGAVHAASARYRGDVSARPSWRDHLDRVRASITPSQTVLLREWHQVGDALAALPSDPATVGLIHFDFELDNLVWHGDTITAIDWDDTSRMWFAADIAYALRDRGFPTPDPAHPDVAAFVDGYRSRFALDDGLLAQLPLFMRLHGLIFYGRLTRACDLAPDGDYPDWLRNLDARLRAHNARYLARLDALASTP